ncbi:MAG: cell division protein FtsQ/DivIB [Pseudomonadota bacterium]
MQSVTGSSGLHPDPGVARPVAGLRPVSPPPAPERKDPAPTRWAWRFERLMLTPAFRIGLRAGIPFALSLAVGMWWLADPERQRAITDTLAETRAAIETRPEFMVQMMAIDGAPAPVARAIRDVLPLDFPTSSFDLDLAALRATILELPPVRDATVRVRPGGILQVDITPRVPVAIWRTAEGLSLIDETGAFVAQIPRRGLRADLPILAGKGAESAVTEGLTLAAAAAPLGARLKGLVRMGERRWDVVLDRDQRILLPEVGAVQALERVIALEAADDVLSRDVARVDMRLDARPTVRMNAAATEEWRRIKQLERGRP